VKRQPVFPEGDATIGAEATIGAKTNGMVITEEREGILPFEANTFLQQSS